MNELAAIVAEGRAALARGAPAVLATVVAVRGSAYRKPGARMLVTSEGWRAGSISGGCLEADVARQAAFLVANGQAVVRSYDTSDDAGARLGCGGEVDVLLEPLRDGALLDVFELVTSQRRTVTVRTALEGNTGEREAFVDGAMVHSTRTAPIGGRRFDEVLSPAPRLVVVGAGHDALPVARLAAELGWDVHVLDWRPANVSAARFPTARRLVAAASELAARLPLEPGVSAVVMAHHLDYDAAALRVLLHDERVSFVGLLGPRHRSAQVLALVEAQAGRLTDAQRAKLRAPVGLDLGAEGPAAIALSIVAEVQAALAGRAGGALSSSRPLERAESA